MATVPPKYRIDKRLIIKTVTEMFPKIYKEAATKHNLIDFKSELKRSKELQELVYRELIENKNSFDIYLNKENLKQMLDLFFRTETPEGPSIPARIKGVVRRAIGRKLKPFPSAIIYIKKVIKDSYDITPEDMIVKLLTLKLWFDIFIDNKKI